MRPAVFRRSRSPRRVGVLHLLLLLIGGTLGLLIVPDTRPSQPVAHSGRGAVMTTQWVAEAVTCGKPAEVFAVLFPKDQYVYTLPTHVQLRLLPTPQQKKVIQQGDVSYDPQTDTLCTVGQTGLSMRYVQPRPLSTTSSWIGDQLSQFWYGIFLAGAQFLQGIIDWATSFGFLFTTPAALTYKQTVINDHLYPWSLGVADAAFVLVLVIAGYNTLFGRYRDIREMVVSLVPAMVIAHSSLFLVEQVIELNNQLCLSILGAVATAGVGDLSFPWGIINWITFPLYEVLAYLIELIMAVMLILQQLARLALLDLTIVLAPIGLLCFALPQTRPWGHLWAMTFVSTLIVQVLQMLCLALGSALIAGFGHSSATPVTILVGIATLILTFQIPGMLLSNALRAAAGQSKFIIETGKSAAEIAAVVAG